MRLQYFIDQLQYFKGLDEIGPNAKITSIAYRRGCIEILWDNGSFGSVVDETKIASWSKQIVEMKSK